ncbi:MAG: hypothetical protein AM326_09790 [Candidatus Thorarchaeota archaeon SMTZ-45]|nr:MAG: hypothetical protein AM325_00445 [Candidatus Thorarchaeota archaeon SMTZ1-45]KXH74553.1 MAG: hypothetical protein AM326_09790 [Candidatus Thorarchaeota archaeon SMTZ-45]
MVSLDGLLAGWIVLNELLGALKERDVFIPDLTYADLRNSKMSIEYLRSFESEIKSGDQCDADTQIQIEMELKIQRLRDTLMIWAEKTEGVEYRNSWETRFDAAIRGEIEQYEPEHQVHISDIPRERDVGFFRIKLPEDIPVEIVSEIAEDCMVNISLDGKRHLQVSGKRECVRNAMKKLGQLFYGESKLQ